MRLSTDQIISDEKQMERYICERLTKDPTRVILASGEDGVSWADLYPIWIDDETGWVLDMETSDEQVTLEEVYDHFRRQEMTLAEWWREFERQMDQSRILTLEEEIRHLRAKVAEDPPRVLTAHDIVAHYQGQISLRLAYQIMDRCQPVRAEKKRLVTADSFDEYLRATANEVPQSVPESPRLHKPATRRKGAASTVDRGFEFFQLPH
jgi:hypothetical protein